MFLGMAVLPPPPQAVKKQSINEMQPRVSFVSLEFCGIGSRPSRELFHLELCSSKSIGILRAVAEIWSPDLA